MSKSMSESQPTGQNAEEQAERPTAGDLWVTGRGKKVMITGVRSSRGGYGYRVSLSSHHGTMSAGTWRSWVRKMNARRVGRHDPIRCDSCDQPWSKTMWDAMDEANSVELVAMDITCSHCGHIIEMRQSNPKPDHPNVRCFAECDIRGPCEQCSYGQHLRDMEEAFNG